MPITRTVTPPPTGLTIPTCDTSIIHGGFDNQVITYAYDKVGNVLEMTDWAIEITNAYDALNRLNGFFWGGDVSYPALFEKKYLFIMNLKGFILFL